MKTGFLQLRHISLEGQTFATAIPRQDHVQVYIHKFQDVLHHDPGDLSYAEYFDWLERNGYTEERTGRHTRTIREEYEETPQDDKTTPLSVLNDTVGQTSIFDYLEE